jgi:Bacteriophage replication gene A protein (GPA)
MRRQITQPEFEKSFVGRWPKSLASLFVTEAQDIADSKGRQTANLWLATNATEINDSIRGLSFDLLNDDSALRAKARNFARECARRSDLTRQKEFAVNFGLSPPDPFKYSALGQSKRLCSPTWWRRQLRAHINRAFEDRARSSGLVRSGKCLYVTDDTLHRRRQQRTALKQSIDNSTLECNDGTELPLADAVSSSTANPVNRRNELMTRVRGLETIAVEMNHSALFLTLTTPSKFHAQLESGHRNPRYDGSTVSEGMSWLNQKWQRARACLHRSDILYYGIRVTEPHHDGTPHAHVLLFCAAERRQAVEDIIKSYWLEDFGQEPGAQERRVTAIDIDLENGSAAGYIAKYVAKNIDGYKVGVDLEDNSDAAITCERAEAWASTHRIRQFQQFGGPVTSLWRELRRLRDEVESPAVETARKAACDGDYAQFVRNLGGIQKGRKVEIRLWREWTGEINQYDEIRPPLVAGLELDALRIRTRSRIYKLKWHSKLVSLVSPLLTWTRSNNCTRSPTLSTSRFLNAAI